MSTSLRRALRRAALVAWLADVDVVLATPSPDSGRDGPADGGQAAGLAEISELVADGTKQRLALDHVVPGLDPDR